MNLLLASEGAPPIVVPTWFWEAFIGGVIVFLILDLVVFHRHPHEVRTREAAGWTVFWIAIALVFNGWIWHAFGKVHAIDFFTAYFVEKSLSVDNLFVFLLIFGFFKVPPPLQHRVLFFGIIGAIVVRLIFILVGVELLEAFHWMNYVFGAILVFTAIKLLRSSEETDPTKGPIVRLVTRMLPFVPEYHDGRLTVVRDGKRVATLLLFVICIVEATDIVFAVDSIPACLAITKEPFIVFTSNIFAILGLRAIYFLLARFMASFRYLKPGLALVLLFVGVKMFKVVELSSGWSLAVIFAILAVATVASILFPEKKEPDAPVA
jgi:tellurite resistance protein TerC